MKWIFITLAGGLLVFIAYSTYSNINLQLQSSAINNPASTPTATQKNTLEKVENTITNTKNPQAK